MVQHCRFIRFIDTPFIMVGTKLDLASVEPREYVSESEARKLCNQLKGAASLQCSSLKFENVDEVFKTAIKVALNNLGMKPTRSFSCCEIV